MPPACVAVGGSCLHQLFPASHGMRESSDFSTNPIQPPVLSSVLCFSPQDQPLMIPLHCILGTHATCKDAYFSLFPLLVCRLVLRRHPSKWWVWKGVSVAIQPVNPNALPDIHSTHVPPSLHCYIPCFTAPPHCSSSAIPCMVDVTDQLALFVPTVACSGLKIYSWSLSASSYFGLCFCLPLTPIHLSFTV